MEPFRVACATVLLGISLFYFFLLSICSLNPNGLLGILPLTKSLQRHAYFHGYIFESAMNFANSASGQFFNLTS